jgi:hypothetical protein
MRSRASSAGTVYRAHGAHGAQPVRWTCWSFAWIDARMPFRCIATQTHVLLERFTRGQHTWCAVSAVDSVSDCKSFVVPSTRLCLVVVNVARYSKQHDTSKSGKPAVQAA